MTTLRKTLLPVGAIIALVVGGLAIVKSQVAKRGSPAGTASIQVGAILPDFELHPFGDAEKPVLASSLPNKVTLINFWATWCEACMIEMPSILKLREAYRSKGFDVLAINVDENPQAVLPKTLQRLGIDFPVYIDEDSELADLFQIQAIPLSVVIDRNRKILFIENGEKDWFASDIRAQMERWLSK